MRVTLTKPEVFSAAICGCMRHIASVFKSRQDQHGFDGQDGWTVHIEGACGEVAAAKAMQTYWAPSVNTFHAPDIGSSIQVRTRSRDDYELIVRPSDDQDNVFVLVTGRAPSFCVRGWIKGADARRDEWWNMHGNRPGAWFVPHKALRTISEPMGVAA